MIAQQTQRWQLLLDDKNRLQLEILGHSFEGPRLAEGQCSEVVVSTRYVFSIIFGKDNWGEISLFVDGKQVLFEKIHKPTPMTWGLANPTYIGTHANGEQRFQGLLTKPVILNERLVPDDQGTPPGLNTISTLPPACSPARQE